MQGTGYFSHSPLAQPPAKIEAAMRLTKLFCTAAVLLVIGPICTGCSTGPKDSDEANRKFSPPTKGMNHDQMMAYIHAKMAHGQIGAPKGQAPAGAPQPTAPGGTH
jgi:hypothetical protein